MAADNTLSANQPPVLRANIWAPGWLAWVAFVVYGSLVPLEFRALPWEQALQRFAQVPMLQLGVEQRADWVANGVLYLPVGFLGAAMLMGTSAGVLRRLVACGGAVGLGLLLALAVEFTQLFFPPRTVSRNDLIAEGIGTVLGAALAWRGTGWLHALLPALRGQWRTVAAQLLPGYALALVALSLFPFDLLISGDELGAKLGSDLWGFWLAPVNVDGSTPKLLARLASEVLVVAPLGWLWARRAYSPGLTQAALLGAALGLGIELAQIFVASGVSQGASVLTRALGCALGAWLWQDRARRNLPWWRERLRHALLPLTLLHLVAAMLLSGWFGSHWLGWDAALAKLADGGVRFVPFYYHYYTSEAVALASLLSVALLYAPLGLWAWSLGWTRASAGWLGAGLAAVVEAGKLFPAETRPDPTNVLVAAVAAWLVLCLLQLLQAPAARPQPASPLPGSGPVPAPVTRQGTAAEVRPAPAHGVRPAYGALALAVALAAAWFANFPLPGLALGALVLVGAGLVWWRPVLIFAVVPAALPLLDLAPWSGWSAVDEFDLLLMLTLAVALVRTPPSHGPRVSDRMLAGALVAVAASIVLGVLIGLQPWQGLPVDDLGSPIGPWQALRLGKGLVWAWALWVLAKRLNAAGQRLDLAFGWGMTLGLLGVSLVVVWERAAFVALWDLTTPYRVAGPFSAMQLGGAYVEAYIVAGLAFALHLLLHTRHLAARALALAAAMGGSYALAVTFSRGGYAAGAVVLLLSLLFTLRKGNGARAMLAVLAVLALAGLAKPFVSGDFARERMATVGADLQVRESHWSRAWSGASLLSVTTWFGHGLGQFPAVNYWGGLASTAATAEGVGAALAVHRFVGHGRDVMLQIGAGGGLYVDQIIQVEPGQALQLQVEARSLSADAVLAVSVCHKWLVSSADCVVSSVAVGSADGAWRRTKTSLKMGVLGGDSGLFQRPVRLSLSSRSNARIDVRQVSLLDPDGRELVTNGRFASGGDRWTFTSDDHLGWHIKNLPLALWFELGVPGFLAMGWLLGLALWRSGRAAWQGAAMASALFVALAGFLVVSAFDTLVDTPRFLLLLLVLAGLAALRQPQGPSPGT